MRALVPTIAFLLGVTAVLLVGPQLELLITGLQIEVPALTALLALTSLTALGTAALLILSIWRARAHGHKLRAGETSLTISDRSLRALIAFEGQQVPGIQSTRPTIKLHQEGWVVRCGVELYTTDAHIDQVQLFESRVREAFVSHTGVPVHQLALRLDYLKPRNVARVR